MYSTPKNRARQAPIPNVRPTRLKDDGFIETKNLMVNMELAGRQLADNRAALYDLEQGLPQITDAEIDPTKQFGFTVLDAYDRAALLDREVRRKGQVALEAKKAAETAALAAKAAEATAEVK